MATIALGFNISASATGMASGVNAAAVELEKLGLAAKRTANDVGVLKTLSIGRAFVDGVQSVFNTFSGFAQGAFSAVEATSNLSRELGIGYSQLQELQIAAELAGVSTDTLGKAFTKAQVLIVNAAKGGAEAVKALSAIGLSASDFQGLSSSQQFSLIAEAINKITDPAQRAAAAVAIFGRSGAELLPAFRELGGNLQIARDTIAKFGGSLSELDRSRVDTLGDEFQLLQKGIELTRDRLVAALAPALTEVVGGLQDFVASLDISAVANTAASVIDAIGGALTFTYNVAALLSPVFDAIGAAVEFVSNNARGAATGFALAAAGLIGYQVACGISTLATLTFATAIRALLASTGIGAIIVLLGLAAGAFIEYALGADKAAAKAATSAGASVSSAEQAKRAATAMAQETAAAISGSFDAAGNAADNAAERAKKAADAARREADQAIQRVTVEQQFGGDSQRYAAAQAVEAIQADIRRTEEEIAAARAAGNQEAIDAGTRRLSQLDQALAREQDIASGARKTAAERLKLEQQYAKAREDFDQRRLAALAKPSTELLQLEDTRTASGYAALQRFSANQADDPAIQEYRKQLKELQAIRKNIQAVGQADTVDIL